MEPYLLDKLQDMLRHLRYVGHQDDGSIICELIAFAGHHGVERLSDLEVALGKLRTAEQAAHAANLCQCNACKKLRGE